jgi:hypothetical protein
MAASPPLTPAAAPVMPLLSARSRAHRDRKGQRESAARRDQRVSAAPRDLRDQLASAVRRVEDRPDPPDHGDPKEYKDRRDPPGQSVRGDHRGSKDRRVHKDRPVPRVNQEQLGRPDPPDHKGYKGYKDRSDRPDPLASGDRLDQPVHGDHRGSKAQLDPPGPLVHGVRKGHGDRPGRRDPPGRPGPRGRFHREHWSVAARSYRAPNARLSAISGQGEFASKYVWATTVDSSVAEERLDQQGVGFYSLPADQVCTPASAWHLLQSPGGDAATFWGPAALSATISRPKFQSWEMFPGANATTRARPAMTLVSEIQIRCQPCRRRLVVIHTHSLAHGCPAQRRNV